MFNASQNIIKKFVDRINKHKSHKLKHWHQVIHTVWHPYCLKYDSNLDFLDRSLSRLSRSLSLSLRLLSLLLSLSLSLSFRRRSLHTDKRSSSVRVQVHYITDMRRTVYNPTHRSGDLDLLRERLRSRDRGLLRSLPGDPFRSLERERLRLRDSRSFPAVSRSFLSDESPAIWKEGERRFDC